MSPCDLVLVAHWLCYCPCFTFLCCHQGPIPLSSCSLFLARLDLESEKTGPKQLFYYVVGYIIVIVFCSETRGNRIGKARNLRLDYFSGTQACSISELFFEANAQGTYPAQDCLLSMFCTTVACTRMVIIIMLHANDPFEYIIYT